MSDKKVLEFSREAENIDYDNAAVMLRFLGTWEKKGTDKEQTMRFAQIERRRQNEFPLRSDGELIAIINRGTPESWEKDPERYAAVVFELRRRGYFVDATT